MNLLKELLALREATAKSYQVKIENTWGATGAWQDIQLNAASLDDIAASVGANTSETEKHARFPLSQLTEIVEDFIGTGPGGGTSTWDEMEFDVKSHKDDVLKISYTFSGVDMRDARGRKGTKYGEPVTKTGVITIMPGNE